MIQLRESDVTWSLFFDCLKKRGLKGSGLIISDAHKELVAVIRKFFTNVSWQRCHVHLLWNIFSTVPKINSKAFREAVKSVFKIKDIDLARTTKQVIIHVYIDQPKYTKTCEFLVEGFEVVFHISLLARVTTD